MHFFKLPIIRRIANYFADASSVRKANKLKAKYVPLIAEARKRKDGKAEASLENEWYGLQAEIRHPMYARQADQLVRKAQKFRIVVPDPLDPTSDEEDATWETSPVTYDRWLRPAFRAELSRNVRDEQRARNDEIRKWLTIIFGLVGTIYALSSVLVKQKQADPCPRNYYRSDSGECVFALQKATPAATPSGNATKPKPSVP